NLAISLVATGLVAVLFQPVRERLQRGVNQLLYGQRDEPYAVVSQLSRRLEATLTPDRTLPTVVETVAQTLKLPFVALAVREGPQSSSIPAALTPVATHGVACGEPLVLPLQYQSEVVGELHLCPRRQGDPWSPADLRLLDELARQVGVAVRAVRLTT